MLGAPRKQNKISQARARFKRWLLLKRGVLGAEVIERLEDSVLARPGDQVEDKAADCY